MFLKMNRGLFWDEIFLRKHSLDGFLKVPMSVDSFTVPDALVNMFKKMANEFAGIGNEANHHNNEEFLAEIRKNQEVLMQFPDKTATTNLIMEQLTKAKVLSAARNPEQNHEEEKKGGEQPAQHRSVRQVNQGGAAAADADAST